MIKAVEHGAELQIFVPSWGYATGTQQIDVLKNSTELCASAIFHISKDSWESFHQDAYWYFLEICTNGNIDKARWYVGSHTQPSSVDTSGQTISRERIIWFVSGTLKSGQYLWSVSLSTENDHEVFQKNMYWWFSIWSTNGLLYMSRWNVGSHVSRPHTSQNVPMTWYADICWMLAYQHDDKGIALDGSFHFLRSAVLDGHRVKLVMVDYSIEADNLVIRSNTISSQLLGHVSKDNAGHFSNESYWFWNHVTTFGEGETIRYFVGSIANDVSSNYTTGAKWFIDTRHWKHVLSTSEYGIATFGSKSDLVQYIRTGSKLRCVVHFSTDNSVFSTW
ncbi:hypothetical protein KUTeg_005718 [Tegillarca granosa]|uniref:Uncharacterized protein n=1 Tax=Tegillarca granosa TaxID=220873 RepID=A0ABQ9FHD5_TEGGR|nr:hypothetical protein KUTeg_005718 [Tegillarca granosa]